MSSAPATRILIEGRAVVKKAAVTRADVVVAADAVRAVDSHSGGAAEPLRTLKSGLNSPSA